MSGGAPHIVLWRVLAVTLGGVLQQREWFLSKGLGGREEKPGFLLQAVELDELPPNLVNTGRLILNIVILAPEQRNFQ